MLTILVNIVLGIRREASLTNGSSHRHSRELRSGRRREASRQFASAAIRLSSQSSMSSVEVLDRRLPRSRHDGLLLPPQLTSAVPRSTGHALQALLSSL
jgi:hypothetical protein